MQRSCAVRCRASPIQWSRSFHFHRMRRPLTMWAIADLDLAFRRDTSLSRTRQSGLMKNKIHLADATLGFDFIGAGAIADFHALALALAVAAARREACWRREPPSRNGVHPREAIGTRVDHCVQGTLSHLMTVSTFTRRHSPTTIC